MDIISPILRRSFPFRAIAKLKPEHDAPGVAAPPDYDYAMGLGGSQAMFLVLKESAADLANPVRPNAPIEAVIVYDTDYFLQHVG